jgi:hypothetical protein
VLHGSGQHGEALWRAARLGLLWVEARDCIWRQAMGRQMLEYQPLAANLMDFDDVALWILEEDLVPAIHRPIAIIRIWHTIFFEALLETFNIVCAEGNMAAVQRVQRVTCTEAYAKITRGQMELNFAIGAKGHIASIALGGNTSIPECWLRRQSQDVPIKILHLRHVFGAEIHVMELECHGFSSMPRRGIAAYFQEAIQ